MTLDDALFDLFALDPDDFLTPELDPSHPAVIGGWPRVWENLDDIVGGAGDLLAKLRDIVFELWGTIWTGIGGAIRWLWDHVYYSLRWLTDNLRNVWDFLRINIWDAVKWMTATTGGLLSAVKGYIADVESWIITYLREARDWIWDRVRDATDWLWALLAGAADFARDNVGGAFNWIWGKVLAAASWVWDRTAYAVTFVRDQVLNLYQWVSDRVWDAALWTRDNVVEPILGGVKDMGGWLAEGFTHLGEKILGLASLIGDAIRDAFQWLFEHTFSPFVDVFERKLAIPGRVFRGEYDTVEAFLSDILDPPREALESVVLVPVLLMMGVFSIIFGLMPAFAPLNEKWAQSIAMSTQQALLTRPDLQEARWRELPVDVDEQYSRYGFSRTNIDALAEIDKRIPGPGDLVRFAVREAFDRSLAEALGFVTDLPGDFALWMQRQGFEEEWAERFWWAHWALPSSTQGFEMFHRLRGEFGEEELRGLLRALDIPPLWHDRFIKIAHQPLTRVDVRRIRKLGLITKEEVGLRYQDLGFSPEDAQLMTEFTERFNAPDEDGELKEMRDLSAGTIRLSYRRHVITRDEALDYLIFAGYTEDVADFLLTIDDVQLGLRPDLDADIDVRELTSSIVLKAYREYVWDRDRAQRELEDLGYLPGSADFLLQLEDVGLQSDLKDARINLVHERFVSFDASEGQARAELDDIEVHPDRQELLLAEWRVDQQRGLRKLTSAQVKKAQEEGIFTKDDSLAYLLRLGYNLGDANVLLQIL